MQDGAREDESDEDERPLYRTSRLMLRPPRAQDAAALAIAVGNPKVAMSLFDVPYPYERADAEGLIARTAGSGLPHGAMLVACCIQTRSLCGAAFRRPSEASPGGTDFSFFVAESHWGRGYGTEIAHAMIDDAFDRGGAVRLWCAIRVTAGAARRVAEKCGFQFRDTGLVRSLATRGTVPVERFVLERGVWAALKSWGGRGPVAVRGERQGSVDGDEESDAA